MAPGKALNFSFFVRFFIFSVNSEHFQLLWCVFSKLMWRFTSARLEQRPGSDFFGMRSTIGVDAVLSETRRFLSNIEHAFLCAMYQF